MYYFLDFSGNHQEFSFLGTLYDKQKRVVRNVVGQGKKLDDSELTPFRFVLNKDSEIKKNKKPGDMICVNNSRDLPFIISKEAEQFFKAKCPQDLQFCDLSIEGQGIQINDYKLVNVLHKIGCLDLSSDVTKFPDGSLNRIKSIVLDKSKISDEMEIFILGERGSFVLVHEKLRKAIEKAKLTGFLFHPLSDATRANWPS